MSIARPVTAMVFIVSARAVAGVVTFDPPEVFVQPGQPAVFEVTVASTEMATFDSVGLLMGLDELSLGLEFEYAPSFRESVARCDSCTGWWGPAPPAPFGVWPSDLFVGGNRFRLPLWGGAPLLIGTLTIDTTGLPAGTSFDVFVDGIQEIEEVGAALSFVALGTAEPEPLRGFARVNVVPEPGMLAMMGVAVAAAIGWRRRWPASGTALVVFLAVLAAVSLPAEGGVVTFDPMEVSVQPGQPAVFEVTVASTDLQGFNAFGLLMGSDEVGLSLHFDANPALCQGQVCPPPAPGGYGPFGLWGSDLFFGRSGSKGWEAPVFMGTLSVGTIGEPAGSSLDVFVDGFREIEVLSGALSAVALGPGTPEPLVGYARVNVVPEPGTLAMMGVAVAVAIGWRRRGARSRVMLAVFLAVLAEASLPAEAGVVTFDPPELLLVSGEPGVFDVWVGGTTLETFDTVGMLIGIDFAGVPMEFDYAASFLASTTGPPAPPAPVSLWASDLLVGGTRLVPPSDPTAWRAPLLVGTLTIDTTGMPFGLFDVFVDGPRELQFLGKLSAVSSGIGTPELLQGQARFFTGVPEPGMLAMMAAMGLVVLRAGPGAPDQERSKPMRRIAGWVLLLVVVEPALGGTVIFDPPEIIVQPGEPARFDVWVDSDMPVYDAVGILFGTGFPLFSALPLSFEYAATFAPGPCHTCVTLPAPPPSPFGVWVPIDLFVGGNRFAKPQWGTTDPLLIGTLTVDTTGVSPGTSFDVFVSGRVELELFATALSAVSLGTGLPER